MQNPKCNESQTPFLPLPGGTDATILHRDHGLLIIDKPPGWRGAFHDPETSARNLQRTLESAVDARADWVTTLGLPFLRVVHSPDACASGTTLIATHLDTARNLERLLDRPDTRPDEQVLAVVGGKPNQRRWTCCLKLRPDPNHPERFLTDTRQGRHAVTEFEVIAHGDGLALLMATPTTRHPHQIRAQLAALGLPIVGDTLYGFGRDLESPARRAQRGPILVAPAGTPPQAGSLPAPTPRSLPLGLRAIRLAFPGVPGIPGFDVAAPVDEFLAQFGFAAESDEPPEADTPQPPADPPSPPPAP
jgi:23S rRNA-/tRNA-specific pseudouridylate synthase